MIQSISHEGGEGGVDVSCGVVAGVTHSFHVRLAIFNRQRERERQLRLLRVQRSEELCERGKRERGGGKGCCQIAPLLLTPAKTRGSRHAI